MKRNRKMLFQGVAAAIVAVTATMTCAADEETAPFELVEKDGKFEVRDYPALVVVSTASDVGDKREADRRFMKLFRYISGGNEGEEKIAMTTPVFMGDGGKGESGKAKMSFVMPANVAEGGAPVPAAEDVVVENLKPRRYAVLRFSGLRSEERETKALAALEEILEERQLSADGGAMFAFYNPPWVPGFLRRNEVLVPLPDPPSE